MSGYLGEFASRLFFFRLCGWEKALMGYATGHEIEKGADGRVSVGALCSTLDRREAKGCLRCLQTRRCIAAAGPNGVSVYRAGVPKH